MLFRFYLRMFQRLLPKKAMKAESQQTWWVRIEERDFTLKASGTTTHEERRQQEENFRKEYERRSES